MFFYSYANDELVIRQKKYPHLYWRGEAVENTWGRFALYILRATAFFVFLIPHILLRICGRCGFERPEITWTNSPLGCKDFFAFLTALEQQRGIVGIEKRNDRTSLSLRPAEPDTLTRFCRHIRYKIYGI